MAREAVSTKKGWWRRSIGGYIATHRRRVALVAVVILLTAGVVAYVGYSVVQWRTLEQRAEDETTQVRSQVVRLTKLPTTPDAVNKRATDTRKTAQQLCDVPELIEWQRHLVSAARAVHETCIKDYRVKLMATADSLAKLKGRIADEEVLRDVIENHLHTIKKLKSDDYDAHREAWRTVSRTSKEVSVDASLHSAQDAMVSTASDIAAAYDKLIAANKAEHREDFDAAVEEVQKGYSKLGKIQNLSVESYARLIDHLHKTIESL